VLDLRDLTKGLMAEGWHCGGRDTDEDNLAINATTQRDLNPSDREKAIVRWLDYYKVLMFIPQDRRIAIAHQIITFADGPREGSLHGDKDKIVFEFNKLGERVNKVGPSKKTGEPFALTSLTSKALWCCYPEDVPIFDRNAANSLRVISRICHLFPGPSQSEYAYFVDLWLQVYSQVEAVISQADLSDCRYKVRALDRLLWYLGQVSFFDKAKGSPSA
jgi:hypothetical protein